jgi:hypothetical protein
MKKADIYRTQVLNALINEGVQLNNRVNFKIKNGKGYYTEVLTLDEIVDVTDNFTNCGSINEFLNEFVYDRLKPIIESSGFKINEDELDITTTNFYDGYEINLPVLKEDYNPILELFNEIDNELNTNDTPKVNPLKNKASDTPINKEPELAKTPNIPIQAKQEKTQNPKRVDLIVKSIFESKFNDYRLKSDVGYWTPVKTLKEDGKLLITWESKDEPTILIETLIFPKDTNKITIKVKNRQGEIFLESFFEIYRIPTDDFSAEKFFRKTFIPLLKKYIDTSVIQIDPFRTEFVFWKTDNPNFSYSFSTPNKNKILLDLISFISTAKKPILDDFFEQNNLKHKQGYLQTLLDSAEAAGIFRFKREGNEILILRGPNYKSFLEGKIRRVT